MTSIFKNKLFILLAVTIGLTILIIVSSQNSSINKTGSVFNIALSPFQKAFAFCAAKVGDSYSFFNDAKALKKENTDLKAKIDDLEKKNAELMGYKTRNQELSNALNLKIQFNDYEFMGANVIAKDPGNWFNVFTIDRGSKDGVSKDNCVITSKGLVGKVMSSDIASSKVLTIIDIDSSLSGRLVKSRSLVRIKGDMALKDQGLCRMETMDDSSTDNDLAVGDTVETSGIGGIFPKGIVVGKVKRIMQEENGLSKYAIIEPAVDFKKLEEVLVLKNKH